MLVADGQVVHTAGDVNEKSSFVDVGGSHIQANIACSCFPVMKRGSFFFDHKFFCKKFVFSKNVFLCFVCFKKNTQKKQSSNFICLRFFVFG